MVPHMHTSKGQADFSINSSRAGRLLLLIPFSLSRLDLRLIIHSNLGSRIH